MDDKLELVLASSSPYRRDLLKKLQLPFRFQTPDIDETPFPDENAWQAAKRLSRSKALQIASDNPDAIIIASDQTAECEEQLLLKPGSPENARKQLAQISGKTVSFYTGLCVFCVGKNLDKTVIEKTVVTFRQLSAKEINHYLAKEPAEDCLGAFKSEGLGITLLESISTNDPNALIGLPLIALSGILRDAGFEIP
ncbi:MAG: septum formation protein Maf [Pseudomonadales bacterium]|nr:septum formation protein Maf [Pseudomonadales bacterium]